ncbi:MAG: hypothetical protein QOI21_901 [Actinomycetota bacterium]|jgi:hypothetical protein|nr:hypothetical protein [Actinomycetota bacterium]
MSIFGQVWLWSLLAFVIGALLTWLVLVLPAHKRVRSLESQLAAAHAEAARPAAKPREATNTSYLDQVTSIEPIVQPYVEREPYVESEPVMASQAETTSYLPPMRQEYGDPEPYVQAEARSDHEYLEQEYVPQDVEDREIEAWTEDRIDGDPAPQAVDFPATEYIRQIEAEPEVEPEPEPEPEFDPEPEPVAHEPASLFQPEPLPAGYQPDTNWFERELVPERSPFQEPAGPDFFEEPEVTETEPAYAFASEEREESSDEMAPVDSTQVLPKRQRRESPRGGFDPPQPIQPSMRAIERREPNSDLTGTHSGSLFEPAVQPGQYGMPAAAPEPPPARDPIPADSVPPGPFGPGSAMPRPGGGRPADEFGVKASVTALRYCTEESPQFPRMVAEVWFRTTADAERVGFRPLT